MVLPLMISWSSSANRFKVSSTFSSVPTVSLQPASSRNFLEPIGNGQEKSHSNWFQWRKNGPRWSKHLVNRNTINRFTLWSTIATKYNRNSIEHRETSDKTITSSCLMNFHIESSSFYCENRSIICTFLHPFLFFFDDRRLLEWMRVWEKVTHTLFEVESVLQ